MTLPEPENIQGRIFRPVGRCIYCGSDGHGRGLRDEHIIPFSLGGKAVLPKASCANCEKITSYLDGYLARHVYYDYRLHAGAPTRRPKDRPKTRRALIKFKDREEVREFEIGSHPFSTVVPFLGLPGILTGDEPQRGFKSGKAVHFYYVPPNFPETIGLPFGESAEVVGRRNMDLVTFARALAKVGYCHLWTADPGPFDPLPTRELVLGQYPNAAYLVGGGEDEDTPPPEENVKLMHWVTIRWEPLAGRDVLFAVIRLFANAGTDEKGMPLYLVALGERRRDPGPFLQNGADA
ncbi:HNH endonuclease [Phenylobacterium sp.]|mgnify:CR=1 FL=1|uniref:HNH endonuclease n=1 Tax=Phenylobacterium sp. TaxID=1871053 RepID=UPI002FDF55E2